MNIKSDGWLFCRLCLQEASSSFDIFDGQDTESDESVSAILNKHFWFEIKPNDGLTTKICELCWTHVQSFHSFYLSIASAHFNFSAVKASPKQFDDPLDVEIKGEHELLANTDFITATPLEDFQTNGDFVKPETDPFSSTNDLIEEDILSDRNIITSTEQTQRSTPKRIVKKRKITRVIKTSTRRRKVVDKAEIEFESNESDTTQDRFPKNEPNASEDDNDDETDDDNVNNVKELNGNENDNDEDDDDDIPLIMRKKVVANTKPKQKPVSIRCHELSRRASLRLDPLSDSEDDKPSDTSAKKKKKYNKAPEQFERENALIREYCNMHCELCSVLFDDFNDLRDHYRTKHKIPGYLICCTKKMYKRWCILDHIAWHIDPDVYKCKLCERSYKDRKGLDNHALMHVDEKDRVYACDECPQSFARQHLLTCHQKRNHRPADAEPLPCKDCGKLFKSKLTLYAHIKGIHERLFTHVCDICAKVFRSNAEFEKHKPLHSEQGKPRIKCKFCSLWLKQDSMRKHVLKQHQENVDQKCTICGKIAPNKDALRSHIRYMHCERKFKCNVCDKAFKRAGNLKEHMSMHTGEVLYKCTFCEQTFNSNANMYAHRKRRHPKEWENAKIARFSKPDHVLDSEAAATNT